MKDVPSPLLIVGPSGSGKTEFSLHLAAWLAASTADRPVVLADADVVNPYFRSREQTEAWAKLGVRVIGGSLNPDSILEASPVSAEIAGALRDPRHRMVIDAGGGIEGSGLLMQWRELLPAATAVWMVLNAARPATATVELALAWMDGWETAYPWRISGLVHTTHWLRATSPELLMAGDRLAAAVAERRQVPVLWVAGLPEALAGLPAGVAGRRLPYVRYTRPEALG
jgi:hypothetical protein